MASFKEIDAMRERERMTAEMMQGMGWNSRGERKERRKGTEGKREASRGEVSKKATMTCRTCIARLKFRTRLCLPAHSKLAPALSRRETRRNLSGDPALP